MHQMRISTTKVSSVVLRPEKSWKSEKEFAIAIGYASSFDN
jgi:hypothetical protein